MCHCDDNELVSVDSRLSENVMTWRNIELAKFAGNDIHIAHVSTKEAMQYIIDAKKQEFNVTCEVTPHHIALTDEIKYRVNPSLREEEDVNFLIKAIKEGYVDTIGTDHAPHTDEDKSKGAPGMSGIEIAFPICYTKLVKEGHITLNKLSEIMSKNPARLLKFNKGCINIGFDGDLVLVDLKEKFIVDSSRFASKGKNTPFDGMELYGVVKMTLKNGNIVYNIDIE
jgi:dihydroorotase